MSICYTYGSFLLHLLPLTLDFIQLLFEHFFLFFQKLLLCFQSLVFRNSKLVCFLDNVSRQLRNTGVEATGVVNYQIVLVEEFARSDVDIISVKYWTALSWVCTKQQYQPITVRWPLTHFLYRCLDHKVLGCRQPQLDAFNCSAK